MSRISCAQRVDLLVVEAARRLVEQQQLRLGRRARAPARPASACRTAGPCTGTCGDVAAARATRSGRRLARPSAASSRATSGRRSAFCKKPLRVRQWPPTRTFCAHRHGAEQAEILEGAADAERGDAVARRLEQRAPLEADRAAVEAIEPGQAVEQRRLAGAVGPDQAEDLAGRDVERDAVERDDAAEALWIRRRYAEKRPGNAGLRNGLKRRPHRTR